MAAGDWSSLSIPGASASPSRADTVAAALEKDLEDERRERREQVAFLNRICAKERELLVGRAESFQRQLVEAKDLWERERALLQERLSVAEGAGREALQRDILGLRQSEQGLEARLSEEEKKWSGSVAELKEQLAGSRSELEASKREATNSGARTAEAEAKLQELRLELVSCQHQREEAAGAFKEVLGKRAASEAEALSWLRQEYTEQRQVLLDEASAEVHSLRTKVQTLQQERDRAESSSLAKLREAHAEAEEVTTKLRSEYEEENQEARSRAAWQLQAADDMVVGLRRRVEQETEAHLSCRAQLSAAKREVAEESASLAAVLSSSVEQQRLLQEKAVLLIERLRGHPPGQELSDSLWPKIASLGSSPRSPPRRVEGSWLSSVSKEDASEFGWHRWLGGARTPQGN
ncbi:unnamed protein product [Effrenium voratum]|nr:unnamed protein product [Effrenium voratum]